MTYDYFWFILRVLAVTVGFAALHLYLYYRLVHCVTVKGSRLRYVGFIALFILLGFGLAARLLVPSDLPFWIQQTIGWPGHLWFAAVAFLTAVLLLAEPLRWWYARWPEPKSAAITARSPTEPLPTEPLSPPGPTRRIVLARAIGTTAAAVTGGTLIYGSTEAHRTPRIKDIEVALARLPRAADGYRIAVVGDLELGAMRGRGFCQRVVDQINRTQPDLIAIVGDLVNGDVEQLDHATEPLARLRSRHGTFFVTGNHEHYVGAQQWIDRVTDLGMTPLPNARFELPHFDLAGVNDLIVDKRDLPGEIGPDLAAALGDRDPSRTSVLLAHQPNIISQAVDYNIDLQLSGHTHGGQIWPAHYSQALGNVQVSGLGNYGDAQLYVTNGAGTSGPPIRVAAPSDITVVTVRSQQV